MTVYESTFFRVVYNSQGLCPVKENENDDYVLTSGGQYWSWIMLFSHNITPVDPTKQPMEPCKNELLMVPNLQ